MAAKRRSSPTTRATSARSSGRRTTPSIVFVGRARQERMRRRPTEKAGDDAIFVDEGANGQERDEFAELWRVTIADKTEQADHARRPAADRQLPRSRRTGRRSPSIYRRDSTRNGQNRAEIARRRRVDRRTEDAHAQQRARGERAVVARRRRRSPTSRRPTASWELAEDKLWVVPAEGGDAAPADRVVQRRHRPVCVVRRRPVDRVRRERARPRRRPHRVTVATGRLRRSRAAATGPAGWNRSPPTARAASPSSARPNAPGEVNLIDLTTGKIHADHAREPEGRRSSRSRSSRR